MPPNPTVDQWPDMNAELQQNGADAVRARLANAEPYKPEPGAKRANGRDHTAKTKGRVSDTTAAILAMLPEHFALDANTIPPALPETIKGILPARGTGELVGESGAAKTTIALDMSCAIATGQDFFGRKVRRPGAVVYFAAEGGGGIVRRFAAAKKHRGVTHALPFAYTTKARNLQDDKVLKAFIAELRQLDLLFQQKFGVPLRLVIIDTLSAAFVIEDENSNAVIANVCRRLARIDAETGAFCLGVHHAGKDPEKGARGGSAHRANNDIELFCTANRSRVAGTCSDRQFAVTKYRDGPEGPIGGYDLKFIQLDVDEDDAPDGAMAINFTGADTAKAGKSGKPLTRSQQAFDQSATEALLAHGRKIRVHGTGPEVHAVDLQHVRNEFKKRWATGEADPAKRSHKTNVQFGRCLNEISGRYGMGSGDAGELIWRR